MAQVTSHKEGGFRGTPADLRFGSNAVRLSGRQWAAAGGLLLALFALTPMAWDRAEPLAPDPDYRVPCDLSDDYWQFSRCARLAAARGKTLVLGDSVIWGQYVTRHETLSHCLNEEAGDARFANLGLNGMHPVALAGLVDYYGGGIKDSSVLVHCNLLWTASAERDLRSRKEFQFNHPGLVPQFYPWIACYTETSTRRIGIAVARHVPFAAWAEHVRLAYFDKKDLATWTIAHPRTNPLDALRAEPPGDARMEEPMTWTERQLREQLPSWIEPDLAPERLLARLAVLQARGIRKQPLAWVDLETSRQWQFFRRAIETLQARGNRVFVLVGPFNEHMLTEKSRARYLDRRRAVEAYLRERGIRCFVPEALASLLYADASHPLAEGYKGLAKSLLASDAFREFQRNAEERRSP